MYRYFIEKNHYKLIDVVYFIQNECARKLQFANFYKLYFPLTYNPEIGTEPSVGEQNLTGFLFIIE